MVCSNQPTDGGRSPQAGRATAAEPVVSALRDGIPSARVRAMRTLGLEYHPYANRQKRRKGKHRKNILAKLYRAQRGYCGICGCALQKSVATIDHVFPLRWGFRNIGNMVVAHDRCNQWKRDADPNGCEIIWLQVANAALSANCFGRSYTNAAQVD
ncbi:MAG: hypothetical protein CL555_05890 [Algoriphagus sp.]|nr:hypothetical protein [Algoriphagus sp.]